MIVNGCVSYIQDGLQVAHQNFELRPNLCLPTHCSGALLSQDKVFRVILHPAVFSLGGHSGALPRSWIMVKAIGGTHGGTHGGKKINPGQAVDQGYGTSRALMADNIPDTWYTSLAFIVATFTSCSSIDPTQPLTCARTTLAHSIAGRYSTSSPKSKRSAPVLILACSAPSAIA